MKIKSYSLQQKLWIFLFTITLVSILFAYSLSQVFYQKLYVDYVKENLELQVEQLSSDYKGGPLTDTFKKQVEWLNSKTHGELFVVNNPRELSACLPFEIDYKTLISEDERQSLLAGKAVFKKGFEERFQRDIVAVIYPLLDNGRLEGIIYSYIPLTSMNEFTQEYTYVWFIAGFLFIVLMFFLGVKVINIMVKPLKEMKTAAMRMAKGDYSTVIDISGRDEIGSLAQAFNQMSQSIQEEDERKRDFLADISHELRTPLSYVKGYTQALLDGLVQSKEDERKYLQLISRETKKLQNLVQDLLDLTKLESKTFVINPNPVAFAQFIEDFMEKYVSILQDKKINLKLDLNPEVIISGDEVRLEQIIQNILENALRYTEADGTISLTLTEEGNNCVLTIEDTGRGISEDHLEKITQRFYRVNKARSRFDGGTGIGLSIVEKLMELHKGQMTIESELHKGTKVILVFPLLDL
ncbi:sensor histidine kinase [Bacillus massiliigorillae]|uniref:sensor histidine kinase n=1 Tax=Bacillus massiliigorillae TaxID=1243664 RepID=UPI0003AAED3C|nr:HAMP domain-containing sensor histidine kinase [Bacillus massiliigorillae]